MRWLPALALSLVATGAVTVLAAKEPAPPAKQVITYRDDRVTVAVDKVPLGDVLHEIAKQSGADLVGAPRTPRDVTVSFDAVPTKQALERLLGDQNFTLKYDDAGKLRSIELRGDQEELRRPPASPPLASDDSGLRTKEYAFWKAFDRREPVPLSGDLSRLFKTDEVPMDQLGNIALGQNDRMARRAAIRAIVQALEQDPEMRDQVLAAIGAMSDEELGAFARARAFNRAEDLVRNVMRETSEPELRDRARSVLRELKKNPFKGTPPEFH